MFKDQHFLDAWNYFLDSALPGLVNIFIMVSAIQWLPWLLGIIRAVGQLQA